MLETSVQHDGLWCEAEGAEWIGRDGGFCYLFNPTRLLHNTRFKAQHYRRKESKQTLRKRTGTHIESFQTKHLHNLKKAYKITQR